MKISDILLEATNRVKHTIAKMVDNHQLGPEMLKYFEERIDYITDNPNYQQWLSRQLLKHSEENRELDAEGWKDLLDSENWDILKEALKNFISVKEKLPEKDINKYTIRDVSRNFSDANFMVLGNHPSTLLRVDPEDLAGTELVKDEGGVKTYAISSAEALEQIGLGSKWCTREDYPNCQASYYINTYGKTYVATMNGRLVSQWTPYADEMKDINNDDFDVAGYGADLFYSDEITKDMINNFKELPFGSYNVFANYLDRIVPGRDQMIERFLNEGLANFSLSRGLFDPRNRMLLSICVKYAKKTKSRWKELEGIMTSIQTNNYDNLVFLYNLVSEYVRDHRWPEANQLMYKTHAKANAASPYSDELTFKLRPGDVDLKAYEELAFTTTISFRYHGDESDMEYTVTDIDAYDDDGGKVLLSAYDIDIIAEYILDNYAEDIRERIYEYYFFLR